jgi:hypothetical protein
MANGRRGTSQEACDAVNAAGDRAKGAYQRMMDAVDNAAAQSGTRADVPGIESVYIEIEGTIPATEEYWAEPYHIEGSGPTIEAAIAAALAHDKGEPT